MRLGKFLFRSLVVVLILGGMGQWWLVRETHEQAARFAARLVPHGQLKYERVWPWPWGSVTVWGVSFVSDGMLGLSMQIPQGMRFEANRIDLQSLSVSREQWPQRFDARVRKLRFDVPRQRSRPARTPDPARHAMPTLFDLGYSQIELDFDLDWNYLDEVNTAVVQLNARGEDLGRFFLRSQLEGSQGIFRSAQDQIVVRRAEFDFEDQGLLQRAKSFSIARARLSELDWRAALNRGLDRLGRDEQFNWDAESEAALRALLREPTSLSASIEPPGTLLLRNLRLYKVADWPALLGFELEAHTGFAHPPLR